MRRFTSFLLLGGLGASSASCDALLEPRDHAYDGPPVIEFAPVLPSGDYSRQVTFPPGSTAPENVTVRVQYVGPPPDNEVNGEFALGASTTAVSGTHFTMPTGYTIPAGENRVDVVLELNSAALAADESVTIVLELTPGQDFDVSENYKQFTITLHKAAS